jgi:hypothetical protein
LKKIPSITFELETVGKIQTPGGFNFFRAGAFAFHENNA